MSLPIIILTLFLGSWTTNTSIMQASGCEGYSVQEGSEPGNSVQIVKDGNVWHTIKLPTDAERNGFGFNWAKKTKSGFEIRVEYGSRFYYGKRFIFVCRSNKFYLTRIYVDSFDRHNPEKSSTKVVAVRPNVSLRKFSIDDFMREGEVRRPRNIEKRR